MDKNGYSVTGFGTSSVEFKSTHLDVLKIDRDVIVFFLVKVKNTEIFFRIDI